MFYFPQGHILGGELYNGWEWYSPHGFIEGPMDYKFKSPYRQWLLPSFLLDAFRLTGTDKPVVLFDLLDKQNKLKLKKASISVGSHPLYGPIGSLSFNQAILNLV